jgi:hypothetical protein
VQTTLAADARLAEGQFSYEEQTLNKAKSLNNDDDDDDDDNSVNFFGVCHQ